MVIESEIFIEDHAKIASRLGRFDRADVNNVRKRSGAALPPTQSAVIATAIPSVCPSVTCWYPIRTNEDNIMRSSQ